MIARSIDDGPTPRRSAEDAREEILQAAGAFLSRHRFRELTVARLMAETSVGRSSFYVYFTDLYDLAAALLLQLQQEFFDAAAPWFSQPVPTSDGMRRSLSAVVDVWQRRGRVLRGIQDAAMQDHELERTFTRVRAVLERAIADAIRRGQSAGEIPALDAAETAIALNQLDLGYLDHWFGRSRRRDAAPVLATLEHIWIQTLYPDRTSDEPNG